MSGTPGKTAAGPGEKPDRSAAERSIQEKQCWLLASCDRVVCGNWCTHWGATDEQRKYWPVRHSDFRDSAPEQLDAVYKLYEPVVQQGRWTEGLLEMWFFKNKPVKHSVHIPCWDSFKWNPLKWRGVVLGRTPSECYWTGLRQMRWARAVYAANLGKEYVMPVRDIGRHGYKSDIKALCWMYCLMSTIFSCGIGQLFSMCGASCCMNFASCYSCHARERMRRRYGLPPAFGLPPGIDDCLVHFFCSYCAIHQELRELAVRGVDGPGMHILDVLPDSFKDVEGIEEVKAVRRKRLEGMLARPPKPFRARGRPPVKHHKDPFRVQVADTAARLGDTFGGEAARCDCNNLPVSLLYQDTAETASAASSSSFVESSEDSGSQYRDLGWCRYCPPEAQEMQRGLSTPACSVGPAAYQLQHSRQLPSLGTDGAGFCNLSSRAVSGDVGGGGGVHGSGGGQADGREGAFFRHSVHHIPVVEEAPPPEAVLRKAWSVAY